MPRQRMRARVYVDGFNLYYGAHNAVDEHEATTGEHVSWKWLDVEALCGLLARSAWPNAEIVGVSYFTARITRRFPADRGVDRQDAYLRALQHRGVSIIPGRFLAKTKRRPLVSDPKKMVEVHDTGVLNPHRKPTPQLWPRDLVAPHFGRRIEVAHLLACQLPDPVTDKNGTVVVSRSGSLVRRPPDWA